MSAGEAGRATANLVFRAFRAIWNFAAERDADLPQNPVKRLRRQWFAVHRREQLVKASEMPAFYQAVCALPNSSRACGGARPRPARGPTCRWRAQLAS
jgi:hypothetical protein